MSYLRATQLNSEAQVSVRMSISEIQKQIHTGLSLTNQWIRLYFNPTVLKAKKALTQSGHCAWSSAQGSLP